MKKFLASVAIFAASTAIAGDEKTQASKAKAQSDSKTEVVVIEKPSRFRVVTTPVQVLKTEVVTKTSAAPATLVVEEKKGLFGRWRTVKSAVVVESK